jgi:transposase-like protein
MDPRQQFCPNMACPARGKVGENNIVVHSRKEARYKCKICGKTFAATSGTPFYRLHHPTELMVIVATLIAHGCPLQAIVAAFHLDERTVMDWQERIGRHCQRVHEHLVQQPRDLEHVQADEIRVKGQGKVVWLAMAIMVSTRLWLGGVIASKRDERLIQSLVQIIRQCALARPLLICVDGFIAYVQAVQQVFRTPLPSGKRGRPWLISWPDIHIGQVIKRYQGKRVVAITRRMAQGCLESALALLRKSHGGTKLNTAFIERLNATFRARLAVLVRRSRALIRNPQTLEPLMYLMGCVYNFCTVHKSLRVKLWVGSHGFRWVQRTPALAAGLTDHIWSVKELLLYRVPLPGWEPLKHRGRRSRAEKALIARWCT